MAVKTSDDLLDAHGMRMGEQHTILVESDQELCQWSFPPLGCPPKSHGGQLILSGGTLRRAGWEIGWAQIVGKHHQISEDSLGIAWPQCLEENVKTQASNGTIGLALADGVGGGACGEVASHTVVRHCLSLQPVIAGQPSVRRMVAQLSLADAAVNKALATRTSSPGAATMAAAWINACGEGWIARVGDARLSVLSAVTGHWQAVLADQSYANLGETPPHPEQLHAPARMVGSGLMGPPELVPFTVLNDEILMLSSDGLHEWLGALKTTPRQYLQKHSLGSLACALVEQARGNGSEDDISILLARKSPT